MATDAQQLARVILAGEEDALEDIQVYQFENDSAVHDDDLHARLHNDFEAAFERLQAELAEEFGEPSRTGTEDNALIPLNGVFRFAVWEIEGKRLFAAAAHEDRELPVLLMLGTAAGGQA